MNSEWVRDYETQRWMAQIRKLKKSFFSMENVLFYQNPIFSFSIPKLVNSSTKLFFVS
jgi:hypothetical protein